MVKTDACVVQLRISRRGDLGDHNRAAGNWILTKLATVIQKGDTNQFVAFGPHTRGSLAPSGKH